MDGEKCTVEQVFNAAREYAEESDRASYLDRVCHDDRALRVRVDALLRAEREAGRFLQSRASEPNRPAFDRSGPNADTDTVAPAETTGTIIDRYKLLQLIGEGGFGAVYMAEQTEPVRRKVALKIIKLGMDTKQVIARFEAERQALAMMDHPNIAKVLDAGATEAGRPYFVMELVKGVRITEYSDTEKLTTKERLELFNQICNAVQHAHQKGVIHRDIKPSNVMVTIADGRPIPKVIDFGIAKATDHALTDKTLFTEYRQLIGTPAYMSPEQAEMSGVDIDTRSDIYSLGVLLYELLTGTTPFDPERLRSAAFGEMQRIIREEDPDKPSTRVSVLRVEGTEALRHEGTKGSKPEAPARDSSAIACKTLAGASGSVVGFAAPVPRSPFPDPSSAITIAKHRRTDPASLSRLLRGDLDWIVMKCLEKDRARRYETANGLAADIQRHLNDEPVVAGPPTAAYRFRKFVRRNRAMVTAATMVVAALLAGTAGTTFGLLRAEQRRAEAETARGRERQQRELAEKREKETQQVSDFQAAMLSEIDVEAMGRGIKEHFREQVRAALERQYVGEFPDRRKRTPEEIEAELAAFDQRADAAQAVDVARQVMDEFVLARAAEALEEKFADQPLVQADLHSAIGTTYKALGLYSAAETHFRAALEIRQRELGEEHELVATSLNNLAESLRKKGDYAAAEPLYREALAMRRKLLGEEHELVATSLNNLAELLRERGDYARAERLYREALTMQRKLLGDEHTVVATSLNNLGLLLWKKRDYAGAERLHREALAMTRKLLGDEHLHVATSLNNLALVLKAKRDFSAAEPLYREALAVQRKLLGDEHPAVAVSLNNLAELLRAKGDPAAAEPLHREALAIYRAAHAGEHPHTAMCLHHLAEVVHRLGGRAEAEQLAQESLEMYLAHPEWSPKEHEHALSILSDIYVDAGRAEEAAALLDTRIDMKRRRLPPDSIKLASALARTGTSLLQMQRYDAAEALLRECLEIRGKAYPDGHPQVWLRYNAMSMLGEVLVGQAADPSAAIGARIEKLREAEPMLLQAWENLKDDPNVPPPSATGGISRTRSALERIVRLYDEWHAAEPDAGYEAKAAERRTELEKLDGS